MGEQGGVEVNREEKKQQRGGIGGDWSGRPHGISRLFDWWRHAVSQAGKTRKCNSGRLSGYDISGSYSICSQTLKWRRAWHGGREVTTVSSLPVNPTTPSVERKI